MTTLKEVIGETSHSETIFAGLAGLFKRPVDETDAVKALLKKFAEAEANLVCGGGDW